MTRTRKQEVDAREFIERRNDLAVEDPAQPARPVIDTATFPAGKDEGEFAEPSARCELLPGPAQPAFKKGSVGSAYPHGGNLANRRGLASHG